MNERMKILISYDNSACSDDALDDLPRTGVPRQADALIVCVQEQWLPQPANLKKTAEETVVTTNSAAVKPAKAGDEIYEDKSVENLESLKLALQRLDSYFPEWMTESILLRGSPAREIISHAKKWNADLIVIGSHGSTENRRFALGSVSQKVANEAACSVRIVRGQAWKNGSPSRLLIGLDGSPKAMLAVEKVARRMWIMGSEVRLVVAYDAEENNFRWVSEYLEDARNILERAELSVTESIEVGDPKQIIVSTAEEWGADCIFLGANSSEGFSENLLGIVATAIVARAHCTVEIMR